MEVIGGGSGKFLKQLVAFQPWGANHCFKLGEASLNMHLRAEEPGPS